MWKTCLITCLVNCIFKPLPNNEMCANSSVPNQSESSEQHFLQKIKINHLVFSTLASLTDIIIIMLTSEAFYSPSDIERGLFNHSYIVVSDRVKSLFFICWQLFIPTYGILAIHTLGVLPHNAMFHQWTGCGCSCLIDIIPLAISPCMHCSCPIHMVKILNSHSNSNQAMHHPITMEGCNSPLVAKYADSQKEKKSIKQNQTNLWDLVLAIGALVALTQMKVSLIHHKVCLSKVDTNNIYYFHELIYECPRAADNLIKAHEEVTVDYD